MIRWMTIAWALLCASTHAETNNPETSFLSPNQQHALEVGLGDPYWLSLPSFANSGAAYLIEPEQSRAIEKAIELGLNGEIDRARSMLYVINHFRRQHRPDGGLNFELQDEESFRDTLTQASQRWTDAFLTFFAADVSEDEAFDQYSILIGERRRATKALFRSYDAIRQGRAIGSLEASHKARLSKRVEVASRLWSARPDGRPVPTRQLLEEIRSSVRRDARSVFTNDTLLTSHYQTLFELVQSLPHGISIVDFIKYRKLDSVDASPAEQKRGRAQYCAFIITPGKWPSTVPAPDSMIGMTRGRPVAVRRVELGDSAKIDRAVLAWRRAIAQGEMAPEQAFNVSELVWSPLEVHLPAESKFLYLVPDGNLGNLPWPALPVKKNQFLMQSRRLAYLPFVEFLTHRLRVRPNDVPYDQAKQASQLLTIGVTPGSAELISKIEKMGRNHRAIVRLDADSATVDRVLRELPHASHAHFTVHGLFGRSALEHARTSVLSGPISNQDALLFSCLYLGPTTDMNDVSRRMIAADTIAELDLTNMELAVLAACETSMGESRVGEGLFNLPRAFHLAGCSEVLSTLWPVNEAATADMLTRFYHHRWVANKPPVEALRFAQLDIYRSGKDYDAQPSRLGPLKDSPRRQGPRAADAPRPAKLGARTPPVYWAGFMLSGFGAAPEEIDPVIRDLNSDLTTIGNAASKSATTSPVRYKARQQGFVLAARGMTKTKISESEAYSKLALALSAGYELEGQTVHPVDATFPEVAGTSLLNDCPELVPIAKLEFSAAKHVKFRSIAQDMAELVLARATGSSIAVHGYSTVAKNLAVYGYNPWEIRGLTEILTGDERRKLIPRAVQRGEFLPASSESDVEILIDAAYAIHDESTKSSYSEQLIAACELQSVTSLRELMKHAPKKRQPQPAADSVEFDATWESRGFRNNLVTLRLLTPQPLHNVTLFLYTAPPSNLEGPQESPVDDHSLAVFVPDWKPGEEIAIPLNSYRVCRDLLFVSPKECKIICHWHCDGRTAQLEISHR